MSKHVERFLNLAKWGANVPRYLLNPSREYGKGTCAALKQEFGRVNLSLIASKEGEKCKFFSSIPIGDALLRDVHLEASGYDVILFEAVKSVAIGYANLTERGIDSVFVSWMESEIKFQFIGEIPDPRVRFIVRELGKVRKRSNKDICFFFDWNKEFAGVNGSKLIVSDYSDLKNSS